MLYLFRLLLLLTACYYHGNQMDLIYDVLTSLCSSRGLHRGYYSYSKLNSDNIREWESTRRIMEETFVSNIQYHWVITVPWQRPTASFWKYFGFSSELEEGAAQHAHKNSWFKIYSHNSFVFNGCIILLLGLYYKLMVVECRLIFSAMMLPGLVDFHANFKSEANDASSSNNVHN